MPYTVAIVAPSPIPFVIGGAEKFWWGLRSALTRWSDYFVELIKMPSAEQTFQEILTSYQSFSCLDLSHFDMVITSKYPAWMIKHPNHVVYMQHTLRGLYDTYKFLDLPETLVEIPAPLQDLMHYVRKEKPDRDDLEIVFELSEKALAHKSLPSELFVFPGPLIRELVHFFDRVALSTTQVAHYFAISNTVRNRQDYLPPDAKVRIMPHPSDLENFRCHKGKYIFTASRLYPAKRIGMLIDAMRYVKADVPLKIAGTGPEFENLVAKAESDSRIEFLGFVPDEQLPGWYANAIFVPFVPYDEDYGLITIEAMNSGKPVITVSDAGGVCEFVEDGKTGFCANPNPRDLGAAMNRLASDPDLAVAMGMEARKRVQGITWRNISHEILLQCAAPRSSTPGAARPVALVLCTYAPSRFGGGGQRRLFHICRFLDTKYDVVLICPGKESQRLVETRDCGCYREISLPWPQTVLLDAYHIFKETGVSANDIALMRHCANFPELESILSGYALRAQCVFLEHPYLYPAVKKTLPHLPFIYDAANVEYDLKDSMFLNEWNPIAGEVGEVEGAACRESGLVICCSSNDRKRFQTVYHVTADKFHILPNGVDCENLNIQTIETRRSLRKYLPYANAPLALFLGSSHKPNHDAVAEIIKIAKKLPRVQFLVGGSVSVEASIRQMKRPGNVHLLGLLPEEVKNLLLECVDIGLNPISSGSGTNLKIIEYIAAGLESISTPFGIRGLEDNLTNIVHVCDLDDFPAKIKKVLSNPGLTRDQEKRCGEIVSNYDWNTILQPLPTMVESLIQRESA